MKEIRFCRCGKPAAWRKYGFADVGNDAACEKNGFADVGSPLRGGNTVLQMWEAVLQTRNELLQNAKPFFSAAIVHFLAASGFPRLQLRISPAQSTSHSCNCAFPVCKTVFLSRNSAFPRRKWLPTCAAVHFPGAIPFPQLQWHISSLQVPFSCLRQSISAGQRAFPHYRGSYPGHNAFFSSATEHFLPAPPYFPAAKACFSATDHYPPLQGACFLPVQAPIPVSGKPPGSSRVHFLRTGWQLRGTGCLARLRGTLLCSKRPFLAIGEAYPDGRPAFSLIAAIVRPGAGPVRLVKAMIPQGTARFAIGSGL